MKIGCLGSGKIVERALIQPNERLPDPFEILLYSRNLERCRSLESKYSSARVVGTEDDVFTHQDVHFIYVALPGHLHAKACEKAIRAHKSVLVEKPFCVTAKELAMLSDLAQNCSVVIREGVMIEHHDWMEEVQKIVRCKNLGLLQKLDFVAHLNIDSESRTRFVPTRLGGGAWYDLSPYWAMILSRFHSLQFDNISIKIPSVKSEATDGSTQVEFIADDVQCSFSGSHEKSYKADLHLNFENGAITVQDFFRPCIGAFPIKVIIEYSNGEKERQNIAGSSYYDQQLKSMLDTLNNKMEVDQDLFARSAFVIKVGEMIADQMKVT